MSASKIIMPPRIARLPQDARGYPIPWNVLRGVDDTPIFTVNDERRALRALYESLCPICGERLGRWRWFTGGPRSAFDPNGWYADLPGHRECIEFALVTCPYLAMPKYLHRVDIADPSKLPPIALVNLDQTQMADRPEIFVATCGDRCELSSRDPFLPYVRPARPLADWSFWRHGERITTEQAMPFLRRALGADWELPQV